MAELNDIYKFVFIVISVGMLLGVGILTFDRFGVAVKDRTSIVNETIAIASSAGSTANDDVASVTYFGNSTINCAPPDTACLNFTTAGGLVVNSSFADGNYDVSYSYDADSVSTTVMSNMISASSPIASTWLPLIITVLVLAVILTLVINSFGAQRK